MADRVPNRFACLSSLYLLRDSRILLLLAAQDAASPPPSRCSLLLPAFVFYFFCPSLSLSLLISLCLSVSLLRFLPFATLLCALPIALRCSFVSFFFLFFSLPLVLSLPICRRIRPLVFADVFPLVSFFLTLLGPSCRSLGFYKVLISLHSLFIFLVPSFTLSSMIRLPRWPMSAER